MKALLAIVALISALTSRGELIGYWNFDEASGSIALDQAGTNNGVIYNGSYVPGRVGPSALHCNGSSTYVRVPAEKGRLTLTGTPYTIAWWQKWAGRTSDPYQIIISMDDGVDYSGGYSTWIFQQGSSNLGATHNYGIDNNWYTGYTPPLGEWEHYAVVFDGTERRFYKNGLLLSARLTATPLKSDSDDPLVFGAILSGTTAIEHFSGDLDEIRIYDHALSPAEISALVASAAIVFATQPKSATVLQNSRAEFSVAASANGNSAGLTYQWYLNGTPIPGATGPTYLTAPQIEPGIFQVQALVSDGTQTKLSEVAKLTVLPKAQILVAHWDFEEATGNIAFDSAGVAHGQVVNATPIDGKVGKSALHFDGTSYVSVGVGAADSSLDRVDDAYTIAWWQRWEGPNGQIQRVLAKDDGADYSGGYSIHITTNSEFESVHNSGFDQNWKSGIRPISNAWQHIALTFDGQVRTLYVNGEAEATVPTSGSLKTDGDDPLIIGAIQAACCGVTQFFKGDLDDIRIYNYALSGEEIGALLPAPKIVILRQPSGITIGRNDEATFTVSAALEGANTALQYQWRENGELIDGANSASYRTPPQLIPQDKEYSVIISAAGSAPVESAVATLRVREPIEAALLGHWSFEEMTGSVIRDGADSHDGSGTNIAWVTGRVGSGSIELNGTNATVRIPAAGTSLELTGGAYTLSWWQKWSNSGQRFQDVLSMTNELNLVGGYGLFWDNGTLMLFHNSSSHSELVNSGIRAGSNWQSFTVIWDGVNHLFYVDGELTRTIPGSGNLVSEGRSDLFLGARLGRTNFFSGFLDDVRVYNYALSADEVRSLIIPPLPPTLFLRLDGNVFLSFAWGNASTNTFRLEQTSKLSGQTTWSPLGVTPVVSGPTNRVTISAPGENRYFRLKRL